MYVEMCNLFRKDNQMKELIKKLEDGITAAEKERSTLTTEVKHLKE